MLRVRERERERGEGGGEGGTNGGEGFEKSLMFLTIYYRNIYKGALRILLFYEFTLIPQILKTQPFPISKYDFDGWILNSGESK